MTRPASWTYPAGTLAVAVPKSNNAKIGECATTYAAQGSCPGSCVFRDGGGCYAETGAVGKFVTAPLNEAAGAAEAVEIARAEAAALDAMSVSEGRPLRLHTVGDCPTDDCARIVADACGRYVERGGGPVWTYTHAWRDVERESWGSVAVLASCETLTDVVEARLRGYATAIVVEEHPSDKLYSPADGPTMAHLPCPAQTRDVPCSDCRLCFDDAGLLERGYSIAFELHGIPYAIRQARAALTKPDDPLRRMPSEERIRIIRDRYLRVEGREPTGQEVSAMIPDLSVASVYEWLRFLRGEIVHPAERRRRRRAELRSVAS